MEYITYVSLALLNSSSLEVGLLKKLIWFRFQWYNIESSN